MQNNKFLRNSDSFCEKYRKKIDEETTILYKMVYFFANFEFLFGFE